MVADMNDNDSNEKEELPDEPNELDNIVKQELDAAVNSLKKRINSLKGVDVSTPRRRRNFPQVNRKKRN